MQELLSHLQSLGYELDSLILDGKNFNRCKVNGSMGLNGWCQGYTHSTGVITATYNDWSTSEEPKLWDNIKSHPTLTTEELHAIQEESKARQALSQKEKADAQAEAKEKAAYVWSNSTLIADRLVEAEKAGRAMSHPYLSKKKILPHNTRFGRGNSGNYSVTIPIYDYTGELCSLQFIDIDGSKRYLTGGFKGYSLIGTENLGAGGQVLLMCEGWATGASLHEATGYPVLVALDAKNMVKLSEKLESLSMWAKLIVCGDNDTQTKGNPGLGATNDALDALKARGISCDGAIPHFSKEEAEQGNTDWNDAAGLYGLAHLKTKLESPALKGIINPSDDAPKSILPKSQPRPELKSLVKTVEDKNGKVKIQLPTQEECARNLLKYFGEDIARQKNDVFIWQGTHWEEQEPVDFKHRVRRMAATLFGGLGQNKDLDNVYNMFLSVIPSVPLGRDLYTPNRFATTFLDGTLWVHPKTFALAFEQGHKRENYLTCCLPVEWLAPNKENKLLTEYLDRIMEGDQEKEQKILALQEMAGQCLLPAYPHIYFNYGDPGTGKSTIAKLCALMVGKNRCKVSPQQFHEFMAEGLINKLVNIHTDISKRTIPDDAIKQIEDGEPMYINRKNKTATAAFIPNLHIWCCNTLPRSTDGDTGSYGRRATIIQFNKVITKDGKEITKLYENFIWDESPQGVVSWAKEGLMRLASKKWKLQEIQSSKSRMDEWNTEGDQVLQFLQGIKDKNIGENNAKLVVQKEAKIRGFDLYRIFQKHVGDMSPRATPIYVQKFYGDMRKQGFKVTEIDGYNTFTGIGIEGAVRVSVGSGPGF